MKISFDKCVEEEATKNQFTGTGKVHRFLSIFWAEVKCDFYLLWGSIARGECRIVAYGADGKRSIIGTTTGSIHDETLRLRRIFWYQNKEKT